MVSDTGTSVDEVYFKTNSDRGKAIPARNSTKERKCRLKEGEEESFEGARVDDQPRISCGTGAKGRSASNERQPAMPATRHAPNRMKRQSACTAAARCTHTCMHTQAEDEGGEEEADRRPLEN